MGAILSFDQFRHDQTLGLIHQEAELDGRWRRQSGLYIWDRPIGTSIIEGVAAYEKAEAIEDPDRRRAALEAIDFGRMRMFIGRDLEDEVGLFLRDGAGRERLRIVVDADGASRIEFLGPDGAVVHVIGPHPPQPPATDE